VMGWSGLAGVLGLSIVPSVDVAPMLGAATAGTSRSSRPSTQGRKLAGLLGRFLDSKLFHSIAVPLVEEERRRRRQCHHPSPRKEGRLPVEFEGLVSLSRRLGEKPGKELRAPRS
jgi:hypothetical protein